MKRFLSADALRGRPSNDEDSGVEGNADAALVASGSCTTLTSNPTIAGRQGVSPDDTPSSTHSDLPSAPPMPPVAPTQTPPPAYRTRTRGRQRREVDGGIRGSSLRRSGTSSSRDSETASVHSHTTLPPPYKEQPEYRAPMTEAFSQSG
ncbi:hypothetical protein EIP86_005353 [Pleurotus ostreatoroseus]|nr:hypothetical protein EIP86_005353 [Pleurotus ostreatoroseus]